MRDKIDGFDWDAANVSHILRHAVTPFEVEEVTGRKFVVIHARTVKREKRWKLFSKTALGRYLVVVFTIRRKLFRTVTAYEMNAAERKKYAPEID
ncbi:MAG: BrnT family toxin [Candidatus Solibacter sp.]|nr:BrnT family toxin [Candidatus Solibacter sp.]